LGIISFL